MRNIEDSEWLRTPELGSIEAVDDATGRASEFAVAARQVTELATAPEGEE
jgi:Tfp pilus assembly protein PilN